MSAQDAKVLATVDMVIPRLSLLSPEAKGDDASHVQWYPAEDLQKLPNLAFNHIRLIRMALHHHMIMTL
jgi:hypothetical protein